METKEAYIKKIWDGPSRIHGKMFKYFLSMQIISLKTLDKSLSIGRARCNQNCGIYVMMNMQPAINWKLLLTNVPVEGADILRIAQLLS
jgi:hypothetical protein